MIRPEQFFLNARSEGGGGNYMATQGKSQMWRRHLQNRNLGRAWHYTLKILKYLWIDSLLTSITKILFLNMQVMWCLVFWRIFSAFMWIFAIVQKQLTPINRSFLFLKKNMFLMFWLGLCPKYWWRLINILSFPLCLFSSVLMPLE